MMVAIPRGLRRKERQGLVAFTTIILLVAVVQMGVLTASGGALSGLYQMSMNAIP